MSHNSKSSSHDDKVVVVGVEPSPLVRAPGAGMEPKSIVIGDRMKHTVHNGALKLPRGALALMDRQSVPQKDEDAVIHLPSVDSIIRPTADKPPITVTYLRRDTFLIDQESTEDGGAPPGNPMQSIRTVATNQIWNAATAPDTDRIRGGGGDAETPPPLESSTDRNAPTNNNNNNNVPAIPPASGQEVANTPIGHPSPSEALEQQQQHPKSQLEKQPQDQIMHHSVLKEQSQSSTTTSNAPLNQESTTTVLQVDTVSQESTKQAPPLTSASTANQESVTPSVGIVRVPSNGETTQPLPTTLSNATPAMNQEATQPASNVVSAPLNNSTTPQVVPTLNTPVNQEATKPAPTVSVPTNNTVQQVQTVSVSMNEGTTQPVPGVSVPINNATQQVPTVSNPMVDNPTQPALIGSTARNEGMTQSAPTVSTPKNDGMTKPAPAVSDPMRDGTDQPPAPVTAVAPAVKAETQPTLSKVPSKSTLVPEAAPVVSATPDPVPNLVTGLPKVPPPQYHQNIPGTNDEMQVEIKNSRPDWYRSDGVSEIERSLLPEWFDGSARHRTRDSYIKAREQILNMSTQLGNRFITNTLIRRTIPGDAGSLNRLFHCLVSYSMINADSINDSTPISSALRGEKKRSLPTNFQDKLADIVLKKHKTEGSAIDWTDVATQIGDGATAKDCQKGFLAIDFDEIKPSSIAERSITPDLEGTSKSTSIVVKGLDMARILGHVDDKILFPTIATALQHTDDIEQARNAAITAVLTSHAIQKARAEEASLGLVLAELNEKRMQRLEKRIELLNDIEGMMESERMALELERRDLYTARCRHWFGGGN